MALWAPVCGPDGCKDEERDPRMLIGTAVNAALNLRLNEASSLAIKLRAEGIASAGEIAAETDKARLVGRSLHVLRVWDVNLALFYSGHHSLHLNQR